MDIITTKIRSHILCILCVRCGDTFRFPDIIIFRTTSGEICFIVREGFFPPKKLKRGAHCFDDADGTIKNVPEIEKRAATHNAPHQHHHKCIKPSFKV